METNLLNQLSNINYKRMLQHFLTEESKVLYTWASSVAMLAIRSINIKLASFFAMYNLHSTLFPFIIDILTILSLTVATSYTIYKWIQSIRKDIKDKKEQGE